MVGGAERSFLRFEDGTSVDQNDIAMKRSRLLLLLMMALGLGGECFALSNRAAAAGTLREGRGVHPVYENGSKAQIVAIAEKSHRDEKNCLAPVRLTRTRRND